MIPEPGKDEIQTLLDYLEGALDPQAQATFEERLRAEEALCRELETFRQLQADLETLGQDIARHQPDTALAGPVLNEIQARAHWTEPEREPALDEALAGWYALGEALDATGNAVAAAVPQADWVEPIMARLAQLKRQESDSGTEALLDAVLEGEAPATLDEACAVDLSAAAEQAVWAQLAEDLEQLGQSVSRALPAVQLAAPVMEQLAIPKTPLVFQARPKRQPEARAQSAWPSRPWLALAAAAGFVAVAGLSWFVMNRPAHEPGVQVARSSVPGENAAPGGTPAFRPVAEPVVSTPPVIPSAANSNSNGTPESEAKAAGGPTLLAALELRQKAMEGDKDALAQFTRWSSVNVDQARAVLRDVNASWEAKVAAAQYLPAKEALPALAEALRQHPQDTHVQYAMACKELEDPALTSVNTLKTWQATDTQNALPLYMQSRLLLAQNAEANRDAALETLSRASERPVATAYPLPQSQRQQQVLLLNGLMESTARFMAAATLGDDAYASTRLLSDELLQQGQAFQDAGDSAAAEQVLRSVANMGRQLADSAAAAHERLAGLDIQNSAYDSLSAFYQANGDQTQLAQVQQERVALEQQSADLELVLASNADLYAQNNGQNAAALAGYALANGDLDLTSAGK